MARSSPTRAASSPAAYLQSLHNQTGCDDLSSAMHRWLYSLGELSAAGIPGGIGGSNSICIGLPSIELYDRKEGSRHTHPRRDDAALVRGLEGVHNRRSSASSLRTNCSPASSDRLHRAWLRICHYSRRNSLLVRASATKASRFALATQIALV